MGGTRTTRGARTEAGSRWSGRRARVLAGAAALSLAIGAGAALAAPGDLDLTFDGDGRRAIDAGGDDNGYGVALRGNGKVVAVGHGAPNTSILVAQLNANGSTDTTFGTGGTGITSIDFGGTESGSSIVLQANESAVVVGHTAGLDVNVARLTPSGALDPSFDTDGKFTFNWNPAGPATVDEAHGAAVQLDGKILIVGYSDPSTGFAIGRLNPNGGLDASFSGDGVAKVNFGAADRARALALQADGKIVVVGSTGTPAGDLAVARLDGAGNLDATFGGGTGKVTIDVGGNDQAHSVAIQADGKIVIGGFGAAATNYVVARLNPDGSRDATFGTAGVATVEFAGDDRARGVVLQANGKIVIAGETTTSNDAALARLQPNGTLDTSFSGDGKVVVTAPGDDDVLAVGLSLSGHIVYAGSTSVLQNMVVGRIEGDGPQGGGPAPVFGQTPLAPGGPTTTSTPPALLCRGKKATIIGSPKADNLRGTRGRDVIVGLAGNDRIRGLAGNDIICAGAGNDRIFGNAGKDTMLGAAGNDTLAGGPAADLMLGGAGRDRFLTGGGKDRVLGGLGRDTFVGKVGTDKLSGVELRR